MKMIEQQRNRSGVFDLTSQIPAITTDPSYYVFFYTTLANAQAEINNIVNGASYVNTSNPQTIYCGVRSLWTNCVSVTNFDLIVNTYLYR